MEKYHTEITPEAIEPGWNQLYKIAGWSGVIMILLELLMGILMLVPPTVGKVGIIISLLSLIPLIPWLFLIVRKFFRLAHTN